MRNGTRRNSAIALLVSTLLLFGGGCVGDNSPTSPESKAPALPDTADFSIDFSLFSSPSKAPEATQLNFWNAVIRVAVIKTVTDIVLTPPIAAFALAIHSVPTRQPDGSWLWVYTWVYGEEEAQIRLRGEPDDDGSNWELRVTLPDLDVENELWFEGETSRWGEEGHWEFYDFNKPEDPMIGRLEWYTTTTKKEVSFTDLYTNPGDELTYREGGADRSIDFSDASEAHEWFIRWNVESGRGSLMVPDYNDGHEACWDELHNDVECPPAS
jgi:hypothetical protein